MENTFFYSEYPEFYSKEVIALEDARIEMWRESERLRQEELATWEDVF